MSGESSRRSNLIDVTYNRLHTLLSGHLEGATFEQISDILKPRIEQLGNISEPYGKPSNSSKQKVQSGSVVLEDGITIRVEDGDKLYIFAISERFNIDEVQALILLRSFLYNEGLPTDSGLDSAESLVEELVDTITPYYYSERLYILRSLIPLFRANAADSESINDIAKEFLPKIIPDGRVFANELLTEFFNKGQAPLPHNLDTLPKKASEWIKQNAKEQLVMLEVLFWTMWDYASCDGSLVVRIYETACRTNMGSTQRNSGLLMDDEGRQIQQDIAVLWVLLTIEVLELERVAEPGAMEISEKALDQDIYWSSPDSLQKIHNLVISHDSSHFSCTYLAWAFVLSRLVKVSSEVKELPQSYSKFFESIVPQIDRSYSKDREPIHVLMTKTCLHSDAQLFNFILTFLTSSPLFVTSASWKAGSHVTDPNAVAFRAVLKGLVIALVELVPVELIPDFDALVEVWIALFGRSESKSVAGICRQFWQADWSQGIARRAIFDVARSRFPIQSLPLIRLLRAMSAKGFPDTDPLLTGGNTTEGDELSQDRELCATHVFYYLDKLSTFTQVVPLSACTGAHALYEKVPERYTSSSSSTCLTYVNLHPIKLPGGSILPAKSVGRLLSGDGGEMIVISWQHEYSGWKVLLEFLTDYVNRKRMSSNGYHDISFGKRDTQMLSLRLEDIGVEMDMTGDETIAQDILDLICSVAQDNPSLAEQMLDTLESGNPVVAHFMVESSPPDLVQLTTTILEEALSRSSSQLRNTPRAPLITSALSVLAALLVLPKYSNRVWLYIRSTASLFGSDRTIGVTSTVLESERLTGQYTMTLALLNLVQALFEEASASVLTVIQDNPKLQQIKEEVLMRAARFVHSQIWIEHVGWKYVSLGDRFEIGRRISTFYADVLKHSPPAIKNVPFSSLSRAVCDALLFKATTSAVHPIVSSITAAASVMGQLYDLRRIGDARRLIYMIESHLLLTRIILMYKQKLPSSGICALEQALCMRGNTSAATESSPKVDPIDALVGLIKERGMGSIVPVEATEVLFALCGSLAASEGSQPTIIGHLSDPEGTVHSLIRVIMHPYEDDLLRRAVWNFVTLAMDKEPALASLFVTGRFRVPSIKGKEKADDRDDSPHTLSALEIAQNVVEKWDEYWDSNPQLLAYVLRFLDVVWDHGHEHKDALEPVRQSAAFFECLVAIVRAELGPVPDYIVYDNDGNPQPNFDAISIHSHRTIVKSHALHIIGLDIRMYLRDQGSRYKPLSYTKIEDIFKSHDDLADHISEAASRTYDPSLHDELQKQIQAHFPVLSLEHLQVQEPIAEREFGQDFAFSSSLLQFRLQPFLGTLQEEVEDVLSKLTSINLNLALAHVQTALTQSWQYFLLQVVPYLRGDASVRPILMSIAASVSADIATEKRSGDMMSIIHNARLTLLLSILEVAWFSTADKGKEVGDFISVVKNLRGIILNSAQPPAKSFLGQFSVPFHRAILQIAYFCARHSRSLLLRAKALNAEQRLAIGSMLEATLIIVIDALRLAFDSARTKFDIDLDQDLELLVAVFEQCTRLDLNPSPTFWLTRCQETNVIRASLQLFSRMDLVGVADLTLLRARKQPLYAPHILMFHMALASVTASAEQLASEGVLAAYSENPISAAIKAGNIDVILPELPGERSPAHTAYCTMLAVVSGITTALGRHGHYFDSDACGLIQLYGEQIHRALTWTIGDTLTSPLLEEIEQVVNLFSAIAQSSTASGRTDAVKRALKFFADDALLLLQQVNYALTHPNHLASLFEPVTASERKSFEADNTAAPPVSSPSDMVDPMRRPFLARLVHRLFKLSSSILSTMISISGAEIVLVGEQEDWPEHQAMVVPHSKVVLGEPTSIGTLLELGNCSLDVLKHLVDRPPLQSITPAGKSDMTLDVRQSVTTVRCNLEGVLFYAVTQLALWLSLPDLDGNSNEMETDENMLAEGPETVAKERRTKRPSMTMAERLRRGMSGEMASDVQALLAKSKPVISKSGTILGDNSVDLTAVLSRFVQERILVSS